MKINKYMFREYDIRGIYGEDINEEISYLIGRAFGTKVKMLGEKECIVGYDNRKSSPTIEKNLVKGITESGINVIRLGLVTTPMCYYGWNLCNVKCSMMITASHNPKEYNGFKFSYNGVHNASGEEVRELYDIIMKKDFSCGKGTIVNRDIRSKYIEMVTSSIKLGNYKRKIIYDCGNGTTCIVADDIFNKFKDKVDLIPMFNVSDSDFPNHHPDPFVEENLVKLKEKVIQEKADAGIAFDGDGDRIGIIDQNGNMLDIDKYMIIIWRDIYNKVSNKSTMYDIKCSKALADELDRLGIQHVAYRTGNSYTKAYSALHDLPFSGELSGHVYFRDKFIGHDDGIYAGLRLIEILSYTDKSISQLLEGINKYYSTKELKVSVADDKKFGVIDKIIEYCQSRGYDYLDIDGCKALFDDGFALIRASNTGPNITYRFEAKTEKRLEEIEKEFTILLNSLIK